MPAGCYPHKKKQFCIHGHDTFICGRDEKSNCKDCINERAKRLKKGPLPKVQFCPQGHDTFIVGRASNGQCYLCALEHGKRNYQKNIKRIKERHKKWRKEHLEEIQKYQTEHKEEKHQYNIQYYIENKEAISKANAKLHKRKIKTDINYKLKVYLRCRILVAIKSNAKSGSAVRDLGCLIPFLKDYLEDKFYGGMTWENWGEVWELDHIIPLISFNLSNRKEFLKANHYTNLQPLTIEDHKIKTIQDNLKWRNKHRGN